MNLLLYSLRVTIFRMCERFQGSGSICAIMWFVCLFRYCLFIYFYFKPVWLVTLICWPDHMTFLRVMYLNCVELFTQNMILDWINIQYISAKQLFKIFSFSFFFFFFSFLSFLIYVYIYTGLFISPSGTSELDCATTKTDTAERSISIGRESLKVFLY